MAALLRCSRDRRSEGFRVSLVRRLTGRPGGIWRPGGFLLDVARHLRPRIPRGTRPWGPCVFLFLLGSSHRNQVCSPRGIRIPGIHSYTGALETDIGKRALSSPPASSLSRFGRNQFRTGRLAMTAFRVSVERLSGLTPLSESNYR